ncbi:hypothetical protein RJ639_035747, partial [Escallonia herrerae]
KKANEVPTFIPPYLHNLRRRAAGQSTNMLSLSIASPSSVTFASKTNLTKSSFHGVRVCLSPISCTPSVRATSSVSSVVKMAKREEELKDIRTKTTEQINEEIVDLKGELFMLRLQRSARNEFKSSEFRRMRKRAVDALRIVFSIPNNQKNSFRWKGQRNEFLSLRSPSTIRDYSKDTALEKPKWGKRIHLTNPNNSVRNRSFYRSSWIGVARMLTVKREREIEEGINKRLSRKFDRQWKKSIVVRPPPSLKKLQEEEAAAEAKESA